ncbi:MAG: hypothetical protein AAF415_02245 [Pseudomonadota bacterium]
MAAPVISGGAMEPASDPSSGAITAVPATDEKGDPYVTGASRVGSSAFENSDWRLNGSDQDSLYARFDFDNPVNFSGANTLLVIRFSPSGNTNLQSRVTAVDDDLTTDKAGGAIGVIDSLGNFRFWRTGGEGMEIDGNDRNITASRLTQVAIDPSHTATMLRESATPPDLTDIVMIAVTIGLDRSQNNMRWNADQPILTEPFVMTEGEPAEPCDLNGIFEIVYPNREYARIVERLGESAFSFINRLEIGDGGATTTYFREQLSLLEFRGNATVNPRDQLRHFPEGYLGLHFNVTSAYDVEFNQMVVQAPTPHPVRVFSNGNVGQKLDILQTVFINMAPVALDAPAIVTGSTFEGCGRVVPGGADLTRCIIQNSADAGGALEFDASATLAEVRFEGNAIDLIIPAGAPQDITLAEITFTPAPSDVNIVDLRPGSVTITLSGGTTPSVRNDGGGATQVIDNVVTVKVTAQSSTGARVEGARVFLEAALGGPLPVGTEILSGLSDVNGEISTTMSVAGTQPVRGRARKSAGAQAFKQGVLGGSISSSTGYDQTAVMVEE